MRSSQLALRNKVVMGVALGLLLGGLCRWLGLTSPAPTALSGALLVVAMTVGYVMTGRWLVNHACQTSPLCAGPDGSMKQASVARTGHPTPSHRTPSHRKSRRHR